MSPVLEFQNIGRSYTKGKPVLDGVSFAIEPGEVLGLLGRNGAGKTTLIRIAMGMLFPHSGSVRVFGLSPLNDAVAVKRRHKLASFLSGRSMISQRMARPT